MKQFSYSQTNDLLALLEGRSTAADDSIVQGVRRIIERVSTEGDSALLEYCEQFDKVALTATELTAEEIDALCAKCDATLYSTMERAAENIRAYHKKQLSDGYVIDDGNGRMLGRIVRPLERVGIYVPGGTAAYPSTVLMNAIPARIAGVKEIILVTPPKSDGIHPGVAAAARIAGVDRIFTIGGAQAVAALAYGTQTVPRVDKIVGPGNIFVAEAKRQVFGTVDIDMIAGPSEVLVIADSTADPEYVAADLLSQLEHDRMASAILISNSSVLIEATEKALDVQAHKLSRSSILEHSVSNYCFSVLTESIDQSVEVANAVAPEHLEIITADGLDVLSKIKNAGSIFVGAYSPEPLGDYFAGTNHVLPTNGTARFSSPLSVDDFVKKMSYISYSKEALLSDADDIIRFAESEGLDAHAASVRIRKIKER